MCQEIHEKVNLLHKEGMPLIVGKAVEKILLNNHKLLEQQKQEENNSSLLNNNSNNNNNNSNSSNSNNSTNLNNLKSEISSEKNMKNLNSNNTSRKDEISITNSDILAFITYWTWIIFSKINEKYQELLESNFYKILTKTTQPAHLISICILSIVFYSIAPELLGHGNNQKNIFVTSIYLLAVATHFGALIWMTFFSGLALYFSLPRHTFGQCQHVLFPMYFTLNSVLSILAFITFIKIKSGNWNGSAILQVIILAVCAINEVIVRLYMAPMLVTLMKVKYNFEKLNGSGTEVGHLDQKDLSKCPDYQNVNKRFRQIHMGAALSNMAALSCSFLHIIYLAQNISIS